MIYGIVLEHVGPDEPNFLLAPSLGVTPPDHTGRNEASDPTICGTEKMTVNKMAICDPHHSTKDEVV